MGSIEIFSQPGVTRGFHAGNTTGVNTEKKTNNRKARQNSLSSIQAAVSNRIGSLTHLFPGLVRREKVQKVADDPISAEEYPAMRQG